MSRRILIRMRCVIKKHDLLVKNMSARFYAKCMRKGCPYIHIINKTYKREIHDWVEFENKIMCYDRGCKEIKE